MPENYDWRSFLETYSRELLSSPQVVSRVQDDVLKSGWLGFPGATEEAILAQENKLGTRLPISYRNFLKVSNGWRFLGNFVYKLHPIEEVGWFRDTNQDWIDAYLSEPIDTPNSEYFVYGESQDPVWFRSQYLQSALEISEEGDSAIYLLNPEVQFMNGEWEAWFFANWLPGASRYRSFRDLIKNERKRYLSQNRQDRIK